MRALILIFASVGMSIGGQQWSNLPPPPPKTEPGMVAPGIKSSVQSDLSACKLHPHYIGSTLVALTVDATGKPKDISVATSSGNECVDKSALAAVSHYKFTPGRRDGVPLSLNTTLTVGVHYE
jgi:TonB family protein